MLTESVNLKEKLAMGIFSPIEIVAVLRCWTICEVNLFKVVRILGQDDVKDSHLHNNYRCSYCFQLAKDIVPFVFSALNSHPKLDKSRCKRYQHPSLATRVEHSRL